MSDSREIQWNLSEWDRVSASLEDAPDGSIVATLRIEGDAHVDLVFRGTPWAISRIASIIQVDLNEAWCRRWKGLRVIEYEGGPEWIIMECYHPLDTYRVDLFEPTTLTWRRNVELAPYRFVADKPATS